MGLWKKNMSAAQQPVWGWQEWDRQGWQPPSAIEQRLLEAKSRGDWAGYLEAAVHTDLFFADQRARADSRPGTVRFTPQWNPHLRAECLALFTEGILPPPDPELIFQSMTLEWYASVWDEKEAPWIAINPGTPAKPSSPQPPRRPGPSGDGTPTTATAAATPTPTAGSAACPLAGRSRARSRSAWPARHCSSSRTASCGTPWPTTATATTTRRAGSRSGGG
ncbi:hypothetical protein SAZ11_01720 [Streptomyces sp. FXJ1.4098]|nr:hypothetical protein [Streptomyces sp. FXJ1.4098]